MMAVDFEIVDEGGAVERFDAANGQLALQRVQRRAR